jgi:hypothetical protein
MEIGAAMLRADWLDGRSLEDWHWNLNYIVEGSHISKNFFQKFF